MKQERKQPIPVRFLLLLCIFCTSSDVSALPDFLDRWRAFYPESSSDDINCQLCHYFEDGGDGWNGYGFDVRTNFIMENRASIEDAFVLSEQFNSDGDENNLSNIEEINRSLFPGWVNSNNNTIIFSDFSAITNRPPPFQEGQREQTPTNDRSICLPIQIEDKKATVICL